MSGEEDWDSVPWLSEPALKSDLFRMMEFKIRPCPLSNEPHDWKLCPLAHPSEKAKRRCPATIRHATATCPVFRKGGACSRSSSCPFAHGVFESWLHPSRYRTKMCTAGQDCKRALCFFAHSEAELREPTAFQDIPALKARLAEKDREGVEAALKRLGLGPREGGQFPWSGGLDGCAQLQFNGQDLRHSPSSGYPGVYCGDLRSPMPLSRVTSLPHTHQDLRLLAASLANSSSRTFSDGGSLAHQSPQPTGPFGNRRTLSSHGSLGSMLGGSQSTGSFNPHSGMLQDPSHFSNDAALRWWLAQGSMMQAGSNQGVGNCLPPISAATLLSRISEAGTGLMPRDQVVTNAANSSEENGTQQPPWMRMLSAAHQPMTSQRANDYGVASYRGQGPTSLSGNALPSFINHPPAMGGVGLTPTGTLSGILAAGPAPQDHLGEAGPSSVRPPSQGLLPPLSQQRSVGNSLSDAQVWNPQALPVQSQGRQSSGGLYHSAASQIWASPKHDTKQDSLLHSASSPTSPDGTANNTGARLSWAAARGAITADKVSQAKLGDCMTPNTAVCAGSAAGHVPSEC